MEEGARKGVSSGGVVKNRNSTGCLIIKKKVDDAGGYSGPDIVYTRKEKKRRRSANSDSESSDDELLEIYRRRVGSNQVSTSGSSHMKKRSAMRSESARKNSVDFAQDDIFPPPERKSNTLDVYDFDEYDDLHEVDKGYFGTPSSGRMFAGSSRRGGLTGDRKRPFLESSSSPFDGGFGIKNKLPVPALKEKFESHSNEAIRLQGKNGVLKVMVKNKYEDVEGRSRSTAMARRSVYLERKVSVDGVKTGKMKPRKQLPLKGDEDSDEGSEESEEPPSNFRTPRPTKRGKFEPESVQASKSKESKGKRGSGTEKQLLREKIRNLLVNAGWTIDYRPRRNRDYSDAVYINPSGTAYWSIIKAYDALQKQIEEDGAETGREKSGVSLIPDDALSKLTRQTQKKIEKEMKRKNRENNASKRKKKAARSKYVEDDDPETDSTDSDDSDEEKLSSFIKPSAASSSHAINGRKTKKIGRCTLLVRNADKELNSDGDSFTPYKGKRTILSWLIDSGIVKLSEKVLYMNRKRTKVMLEGWITRDGIHCGCCSKILTVSKFEIHAASKLRQPYQNICLPSGVSLLQCQVDAWNSQDDPQRTGFNRIDVDGDDPNDDTCGICGDGGNLICCDGCPSTFHQSCLGIEMLPPGDWHCPHCSCKFCGLVDVDTSQSDENTSNELVGCSLCNRKYHKACIPEMDSASSNSSSQISFCGRKCQELFERLQKLLGVKHEIESGLSWSLIHRIDLEADPSHRRVEWNAKLAVSLTVMVECFLPITDRRSGVNLIQSVLYNCRSNFNRLNYGGFYTAVLERGDEIISAASIRIHGNQLAEMPFIGTRHIYRRQGMCRRLLLAIERALRSLKVEKLIIPAISDMMHTWTNVFGFSALGDSQKHEMKSLNMLVFPGTDMLQKKLLPNVVSNRDVAACTGTDLCKDEGETSPLPEISPSNSNDQKSGVPENDGVVEKSDSGPNLQNSSAPGDLEVKLVKCVASDMKADNDENTVEVGHSGSEAVNNDDTLSMAKPEFDSPTQNKVEVVEPDFDDSNSKESKPINELDSAIEESIEPMTELVVNQEEEAKPDSSNTCNIQNYVDEPGFIQKEEAKPDSGNIETKSLLQLPTISSNGTSVSLTDNIIEPVSFSVDHSQTEDQLEVPVPATKTISSFCTQHESNGLSSIENKAADGTQISES